MKEKNNEVRNLRIFLGYIFFRYIFKAISRLLVNFFFYLRQNKLKLSFQKFSHKPKYILERYIFNRYIYIDILPNNLI